MSTGTRTFSALETHTSTTSSTAVWARSVTAAVNYTLKTAAAVVEEHGLPLDKLADQLPSIERAARVRALTGHLQSISVEIFRPGSDRAERRFDLEYGYAAQQGPDHYNANIDGVRNAIRQGARLDGQHDYRIVLTSSPGAPAIEGWTPTTFRDTGHLQATDIGTVFGTPRINARGRYWNL